MFVDDQFVARYPYTCLRVFFIDRAPAEVCTASLESVANWFPPTPQGFPGITPDEARQRFRATLEINGVPAFWEDQLFGEDERRIVRFKIGDVNFEGSNPCARCPVPPRNPQTGEILEGFQKRFTQLRESTLPPWSPRPRFDHFYRLAPNTPVAATATNKLVRLRDPLHLSSFLNLPPAFIL